MENTLQIKNLFQSLLKDMNDKKYQFAEIFYGQLFEIEPSLKPLFRNDKDVEALTFEETINLFYDCYNDFEGNITKLKKLGLKHKGYGVKKRHYPIMKTALINSFRIIFQNKFDSNTQEECEKFYDKVSETMILGSRRK